MTVSSATSIADYGWLVPSGRDKREQTLFGESLLGQFLENGREEEDGADETVCITRHTGMKPMKKKSVAGVVASPVGRTVFCLARGTELGRFLMPAFFLLAAVALVKKSSTNTRVLHPSLLLRTSSKLCTRDRAHGLQC